jgi:hypothetical protein
VSGNRVESDTARPSFTAMKYVTINNRFMSTRQSNVEKAIRVKGFAVL